MNLYKVPESRRREEAGDGWVWKSPRRPKFESSVKLKANGDSMKEVELFKPNYALLLNLPK